MKINLLWPTWARVVSRFPVSRVQARGLECWHSIKRAARLLVERQEREHKARFYREASPAYRATAVYSRRIRRALSLVQVLVFATIAFAPVASAVELDDPGQEEQEQEQESTLFRTLGFAVYAASAGDVFSTELALSNGAYEGNPLVRYRGVRIGSHVGAPLTLNETSAKLYRDGKKKTALWMRIGFIVGYGYLTAHNLREWRR